MPYLHWETSTRKRRSVALSPPSMIISTRTQKKHLEMVNSSFQVNSAKIQAPDFKTLAEVVGETLGPRRTLHKVRSLRPTTTLGEVLFRAAVLYEAMDCYDDQRLLDECLRMNSPLHPRRSLYQYKLWSSGKDDADQTVYRASYSQARPVFYLEEPKLIMVDQLWLWILDESMFF
jgi:hypothetical protein